MLEHVKGTNVQIPNCRISMTQGNRIPRGTPVIPHYDSVAEAKGLEPDQGLIAMSTYKQR